MIRELLASLFGRERPQAATAGTTDIGWWNAFTGGGRSASGVNVTPTNALKASPVYAAVKVIAEDIAKLPLCVYERSLDNRGRMVRQRVHDHPVQLLLDVPNNVNDRFQFKDFLSSQAVLNGNGIAWIERTGAGRPIALHPVPAPYVSVHQAPTGEIFYGFSPPAHLTDVIPLDLVPKRDVLHVMGTSENGFWGLSPIARLCDAVGLTLALEEHGSELFKNGADPGGVLTYPRQMTNENMFNRLRKQWDERYTGKGNRGKTVILEDGMKFDKLSMSSVDAQFIEGRKFQVEEVARIFRLPPQKLMSLDRATFNNIEHLALDYINDTLMPWLERWEAQLQARLFTRSEQERYFVEFDVRRLARGDLKSRVGSAREGVQSGVMEINEARGWLDLDPVEGGDVRLEPLNMVQAGGDRVGEREMESSDA